MTLAYLAGDVNIWEKVHFDFNDTVSLTGLAPSALDVEGKTAGGKASHLGVGRGGVQLPDIVEHPRIGGRMERGVRRLAPG